MPRERATALAQARRAGAGSPVRGGSWAPVAGAGGVTPSRCATSRADAEGRGRRAPADLDRALEEVGLQLHQQRRRPWRRRRRAGPRCGRAVGLHRVHDVGDLVGDRLEGRSSARWAGVVPARDPGDEAGGRAVPVRGAQAGERGHEGDPTVVVDARGQLGEEGAAGGTRGGAQGGGHPVQGRPGGHDVALAGVGRRTRRCATPPSWRSRPAPSARSAVGTHHRAPGAVGGLTRAGSGAPVLEEGGVRVGQHRDDGHAGREPPVPAGGHTELAVGGPDLGKVATVDTEQRRSSSCQVRLWRSNRSVREAFPGSVSVLAGELPEQPRVDGAHRDIRAWSAPPDERRR